MQLAIPYGTGSISVEVPNSKLAGIVQPRAVPGVDSASIYWNAFQKPLGVTPADVETFLLSDSLLIVNDGTRPTPTLQLLSKIDEHIGLARHEYLVATGAHALPTETELVLILGSHAGTRNRRLHVHDAQNSSCVYLGRTSTGTEVRISEQAAKARRLVIVTSVEPHYFAGYTGGRKSILPGVSAYTTIEQNHFLALEPAAEALALRANPVHQDMLEALELLGKDILSINAVLDRKHELYSLCVGDVYAAFQAAAEKADEVFAVSTDWQADVVVAVALPPMDVDFYQAQKALENGRYLLRKGGILILVAECTGGVGNPSFVDLLSSSGDAEQTLRHARANFKLGYQKAARIAGLLLDSQIWAVTNLNSATLAKIGVRACSGLQDAVDEALAFTRGKVSFLLDATLTVPRVGRGKQPKSSYA